MFLMSYLRKKSDKGNQKGGWHAAVTIKQLPMMLYHGGMWSVSIAELTLAPLPTSYSGEQDAFPGEGDTGRWWSRI